MRRDPTWPIVAVLLAWSATSPPAGAEPGPTAAYPSELLRPYVPAVSMEQDRRITPKNLRKRRGEGELMARFGASGIVRCGNAVGTAQLTLKTDLITTAAHVLLGNDGQPRAATCTFEPAVGGSPIKIDMGSIKAGSRTPLSEPAVRDWAIARLAAPIEGATPYNLAPAGTTPSGVYMSAGGYGTPARMATEQCSVRQVLAKAPDGIREFAIDCSAAPGSSGGALIVGRNICAIYVGFRSTTPQQAQAFSAHHYNFAITVDGPFRRAVLAAAAR